MSASMELLAPGRIGTMETKNRVLFSPMGTFLADTEGHFTQEAIDYYAARARGGTGVVIVEMTQVHPTGQPASMAAAYDDSFLPGMTRLAEAIKVEGARACMQIGHCGRQIFGATATGAPIVAASPIPCPMAGVVPKELTEEEILELIESFGDTAARVKQAGFDAVEIHCAHGYLIHNFLSARSNVRTDRWGGSYENRSRFAREIMKKVREKVGDDFPVLTRISSEEIFEGGVTLEDQVRFAKDLETWGSDAIDVSVGAYGVQHYLIPPIDMPLALNADRAAAIKQAVHIPVIVVGRINDPILANNIISQGKADFVNMGRGLIADPEFVNKVAAGELDEIVKCIGCNQGCFGTSLLAKPIRCLRNPAAGREAAYALKPAAVKKKVLVVGGGPAGLEAAITLQRRGHEVTLCEKSSSLGGNFYLAGIAPRKKEMSDAALQMGRAAKRAGVRILMQTEVTPAWIERFAPDAVIVATGSLPVIPRIDGVDAPHVMTAYDILRGTRTAGDSVAVIGGNAVGGEVAELLSENGKRVVLLEMTDRIASSQDFVRNGILMEHLAANKVEIHTGAKCVEIKDNAVVIEKDGARQELGGIDTVVIAVGGRPHDPLSEALAGMGVEHYVIGDAKEVADAYRGIDAAAKIAREI
ncbi:MAG: FAD-dependent oxidoreductase [Clostridia bacterium]|nr:FAD-dependent oxidoreductase [Clostridia bacterium]